MPSPLNSGEFTWHASTPAPPGPAPPRPCGRPGAPRRPIRAAGDSCATSAPNSSCSRSPISSRSRPITRTGSSATSASPNWCGRSPSKIPSGPAGLLHWLRRDGRMRTASIVGAAEYVKARLDAGVEDGPSNRQAVDSVLLRADEPGELLGYWTSRYGRAVPKPVKHGIADAVRRLLQRQVAAEVRHRVQGLPLRRHPEPGARLARPAEALAGRAVPVRPRPPPPPRGGRGAGLGPGPERAPRADGAARRGAAGRGREQPARRTGWPPRA